ncbi:MAG: ABC transporter permease subunit [Clostridiaceae bacterium]
MNVFLFEIKSQFKSALIWTVSILGGYLLFVAVFFGAFMESRTAVEQALGNLPPAFAAVFGLQLANIFSFGGFFSFAYTYIGVVGAIMAASMGFSVFAREKRNKCVDFLLVKPVRRGTLFLNKFAACLGILTVFNALFLACVAVSYTANGQDPAELGRAMLAASSLFFLQLVFFSLSTFFAVMAKKIRSVSGAATAMGFAGFLVTALYSLTEEEAIRFVSPLQYFSPGAVFFTGGFETKYMLTAAAVCALCLCTAFLRYCRSDTKTL